MENNFIMSIFGKKASGKSYFANWMIEGLNRLIVYDTVHQFNKNFIIITEMEQFKKIIELIKDNKIISFRISLQFKEYNKYFAETNKLVVENIHYVTYVVDEIHNYVSTNKYEKYLSEMIVEGRHLHINLITISHRPAGLPPSLLLNADYLAIFETSLKRDKDFYQNFKYFKLENLENLGDYEFVFINSFKKYSSVQKIT